jgi:hypothetical protein
LTLFLGTMNFTIPFLLLTIPWSLYPIFMMSLQLRPLVCFSKIPECSWEIFLEDDITMFLLVIVMAYTIEMECLFSYLISYIYSYNFYSSSSLTTNSWCIQATIWVSLSYFQSSIRMTVSFNCKSWTLFFSQFTIRAVRDPCNSTKCFFNKWNI